MADSAEMQKVLGVIKWVQGNIKLERFDPKTYSRVYGRRSVAQIIKSGKMPYLNTCPDIAMTISVLLKEAGFNPTFVGHEHIGQRIKGPLVHFAVEVKIDGQVHTINTEGFNEVHIYRGKYDPAKSKPGRKHLGVVRISTAKFNRKTTFLSALGVRNFKEFGQRFKYFGYAEMRKTLKHVRETDSKRLFKRISTQKKRIIRL